MIMRKILGSSLLLAVIAFAVPAQAADWVTITNSVEVSKPVDAVWKRIGDYCEISEWMKVTCTYARGQGELGSIRVLLNGATTEVMVAKTAHSYTYWQNVGNMAPASFHGTLMAEPDGMGMTKLSYTLVYDQDGLPADKRESEHTRLQGRFHDLLGVMKGLSEGP
jgi:hypothetical protein